LRAAYNSAAGCLLAAACLATLCACGADSDELTPDDGAPDDIPGRTLLLVTLDTTRADHLGSYGWAEAATPVIDRLAEQGILYEQAYAPTPITLPSHASILTGVLPAVHGVRDNGQYVLGDEAMLVSEVLSDNGWRSAAFVASFVLDASFGLDQGFEHYSGASATDLGAQGHFNERPAAAVVDDALAWLTDTSATDDLFLWVHFYDPHWPYEPADDWTGAAYDGEIAGCDTQLGRLLTGLTALQRDDGLVTLLTADHGESLGERGETSHGVFLYESSVRVPLIVSGQPVAAHAGTRLAGPVSNASIAPTLLKLAGIPTSALPRCDLRSLIGAYDVPVAGRERDALMLETWYPYHSYRWHPLNGLVWNGHKLIRGASTELYALAGDPTEQNNLAQSQPELVASMQAQLDATRSAAESAGWADSRALDGAELAQLRALGYAGGSSGAADIASLPGAAELPDGRDLVADTAALDSVRTLLAQVQAQNSSGPPADQFEANQRAVTARELLLRCRRLLEPVQARHAANPMAAAYRGTVESALGEHDSAIPHLELAVRSNPRDPAMRYTLGNSYQQLGRFDAARHEMLASLTIEPRYSAAINWMIWYRSRTGELGRAVWWSERFLAALPGDDPNRPAIVSSVEQLRQQMLAAGLTPTPDEAFPLDDLRLFDGSG
jgi:arylsulfatase A-like enzyme